MNKKAFLLIFLLAFLQFPANAQTLDAELIYQGQPIDSLCFYEMGESNSHITDLTRCGLQAHADYKKAGPVAALEQKGFFGYAYKIAIAGDSHSLSGYSYYKVLGHVPAGYLIYTLNNGGGTGEFSTLNLIRRRGNQIENQALAGGDRCNGGIANAKIDKETLTYQARLTAFDFLDLAKENPLHLKPFDDLDSCAICCVGEAAFAVNFPNNKPVSQFLYLDFAKYPPSAEASSMAKYQRCFNTLLASYYKAGKIRLDLAALQQFVEGFDKQCDEHPAT